MTDLLKILFIRIFQCAPKSKYTQVNEGYKAEEYRFFFFYSRKTSPRSDFSLSFFLGSINFHERLSLINLKYSLLI